MIADNDRRYNGYTYLLVRFTRSAGLSQTSQSDGIGWIALLATGLLLVVVASLLVETWSARPLGLLLGRVAWFAFGGWPASRDSRVS